MEYSFCFSYNYFPLEEKRYSYHYFPLKENVAQRSLYISFLDFYSKRDISLLNKKIAVKFSYSLPKSCVTLSQTKLVHGPKRLVSKAQYFFPEKAHELIS